MGFSWRQALGFAFGGGMGWQMAAQYEQGKKAERAQQQALADQKAAQDAALSASISERRRAAQALRAANRKTPDPMGLLAREQSASLAGIPSTLLTGPQGVARKPKLGGQPTLLGDPGSI